MDVGMHQHNGPHVQHEFCELQEVHVLQELQQSNIVTILKYSMSLWECPSRCAQKLEGHAVGMEHYIEIVFADH